MAMMSPLLQRLLNDGVIELRDRPDEPKPIRTPGEHQAIDWANLATASSEQLRLSLRQTLPRRSKSSRAQHTTAQSAVMRSERRRRQAFTIGLQQTIDLLHRRHFAFTHIPRGAVEMSDAPVRALSDTLSSPHWLLSEFQGPRLTGLAKKKLLQKKLPVSSTGKYPVEVQHENSFEPQYVERILSHTYSPRRSGHVSGLPETVARSWFQTAQRPRLACEKRAFIDDLPGVMRPSRDATQPTESFLRQQGLIPETPLRESDGYIPPPEDRLRRRREYGKGRRRTVAPVSRRPVNRVSMSPVPVPEKPSVEQLLSQAGIFVRAGDIRSFIRRDALDARTGLLRADERRHIKMRLGGSSGPRLV